MKPEVMEIPNTEEVPDTATHRQYLDALSRYTSRDTIVIAAASSGRRRQGIRSDVNLSYDDVDGLSMVIRDLDRPHLNLVLHGAGGHLDAAAEMVSLLPGRFESIRAMVPERALSAMALIACACDVIMMPGSAVIGPTDEMEHCPLSANAAQAWLSKSCEHPDRAMRAQSVALVFSTADGPRAPLTAASAKRLGLPISVIPEQSAIGRTLDSTIIKARETMGTYSLVKLIDCQKGPVYRV